jgi:hypothetical protein
MRVDRKKILKTTILLIFQNKQDIRERLEMKKKDKKETINDLYKLKNEIAFDKVSEVLKNNPENYKEELAKIGFQWFDDEYPDEIEEENNAVPENRNQEFLVAYFNGDVELSNSVIETFLAEKHSDEPNFALIRRYFRQGNQHLKSLIYRGLEINPTDIGFLNDLSFFHEFHPMLGELIRRYTDSCRLQQNLETFRELARDFYCNTAADGYEAYHALKEIYASDTQKGMIIDHLIQAEKEFEDPITF